ncbi:hypothetical protein JCM8547_007488, partial [Rhodosporidiobolus lusitaniae]
VQATQTSTALTAGLARCRNLKHLTLGGASVLPTVFAHLTPTTLPSLQRLAILLFAIPTPFTLTLPLHVKSLTVCHPMVLSTATEHVNWRVTLENEYRARSIQLWLVDPREEIAWLNWHP